MIIVSIMGHAVGYILGTYLLVMFLSNSGGICIVCQIIPCACGISRLMYALLCLVVSTVIAMKCSVG